MAQLTTEDLGDLLPLLLLAKMDASGVMDEVKAAEAICRVIDRHVAEDRKA